jgi:hypothetical protein
MYLKLRCLDLWFWQGICTRNSAILGVISDQITNETEVKFYYNLKTRFIPNNIEIIVKIIRNLLLLCFYQNYPWDCSQRCKNAAV